MRTLVTYLVAAALTLHMLLGCCRHHAHDSASDCRTGVSCDAHDEIAELEADHEHHDGDCSHHDDDFAANEHAAHRHGEHFADEHQECEHGKPGSQQESCGEKCSFVTANRVSIELDAAVVALGVFASAAEVATANEFFVRRWEAWGASDAPPPIRLHLLHQLLLI